MEYYNDYKPGDIAYAYAFNHNNTNFRIPEFKILKLKILEKLRDERFKTENEYKVEILTNKEYLPLTYAGNQNPIRKKPLDVFFYTWMYPTLDEAIAGLTFAAGDVHAKEVIKQEKEKIKLEKRIVDIEKSIIWNANMRDTYKQTLAEAIKDAN